MLLDIFSSLIYSLFFGYFGYFGYKNKNEILYSKQSIKSILDMGGNTGGGLPTP